MKKKLLINFFIFFLATSNSFSDTRFGELTEMRDEKMRGKDNQWVRPHPGPFIWNHIEKEKGKFTWEEADKYVVYAQATRIFIKFSPILKNAAIRQSSVHQNVLGARNLSCATFLVFENKVSDLCIHF